MSEHSGSWKNLASDSMDDNDGPPPLQRYEMYNHVIPISEETQENRLAREAQWAAAATNDSETDDEPDETMPPLIAPIFTPPGQGGASGNNGNALTHNELTHMTKEELKFALLTVKPKLKGLSTMDWPTLRDAATSHTAHIDANAARLHQQSNKQIKQDRRMAKKQKVNQ